MGYNVGTVDGSLGPRSRSAITQFQVTRGEAGTGQLTRAQFVALMSAVGNPGAAYVVDRRLSRDEVVLMQVSLQRLGFYTSRVDGSAGPGTRRAREGFLYSSGHNPLTITQVQGAVLAAQAAGVPVPPYLMQEAQLQYQQANARQQVQPQAGQQLFATQPQPLQPQTGQTLFATQPQQVQPQPVQPQNGQALFAAQPQQVQPQPVQPQTGQALFATQPQQVQPQPVQPQNGQALFAAQPQQVQPQPVQPQNGQALFAAQPQQVQPQNPTVIINAPQGSVSPTTLIAPAPQGQANTDEQQVPQPAPANQLAIVPDTTVPQDEDETFDVQAEQAPATQPAPDAQMAATPVAPAAPVEAPTTQQVVKVTPPPTETQATTAVSMVPATDGGFNPLRRVLKIVAPQSE